MKVFEFEVHRASPDELKRGVVAAEVVKVLAAGVDLGDAYRAAVDVAWRPERMVTACLWVP